MMVLKMIEFVVGESLVDVGGDDVFGCFDERSWRRRILEDSERISESPVWQ